MVVSLSVLDLLLFDLPDSETSRQKSHYQTLYVLGVAAFTTEPLISVTEINPIEARDSRGSDSFPISGFVPGLSVRQAAPPPVWRTWVTT